MGGMHNSNIISKTHCDDSGIWIDVVFARSDGLQRS